MENTVRYHKETGLLFFKEIPFTKERVKALKALVAVSQFEINITIKDKACDLEITLNNAEINILVDYAEGLGYDKMASDRDFNN